MHVNNTKLLPFCGIAQLQLLRGHAHPLQERVAVAAQRVGLTQTIRQLFCCRQTRRLSL